MNRKIRITAKNWKKRVIFHLNAFENLSSYKNLKKKKKTNKFKVLTSKKKKNYTNKLYHLDALKHLYSIKSLRNTKKVKEFKSILINFAMNEILEAREHEKNIQKLNQEMIQIKTKKLILKKPK